MEKSFVDGYAAQQNEGARYLAAFARRGMRAA